MNCEIANQIDINSFLSNLNIHPVNVKNHQWWYFSPLRIESEPSFKVDARLNLWYDFGIGKGGTLIDLGCALLKISVSGLLNQLTNQTFSFHSPEFDSNFHESKIRIRETKKLTSISLITYLLERGIRLGIANQYCQEVHFSINEKSYYAIGFENDLHGFELRNRFLKVSSSPKTYTWIKNDSTTLCVFEGFMDFLSWFEIKLFYREKVDFLILNSISFIGKCKDILNSYSKTELYLDNDPAGNQATQKLLETGNKNFLDRSLEFGLSKDLNQYLRSAKNRISIP